MNRLVEVWSEFQPRITVIYRTLVDTLWTKAGLSVASVLLLISLYLIPLWIEFISVVIIILTTMVWSLFGFGKKPTYEPAKRQISITTSSGSGSNTITDEAKFNSVEKSSRANGTVSGSLVTTTTSDNDNNINEDMNNCDLDSSSTTTSVSERLQKQSISTREPLDPITWSAVTSPGFTTRVLQKRASSNALRESNSPNRSKGSLSSSLGLGQLPAPWKPPSKLNPPSFQSPVNTGRYSVTKRKKQVPFGTTFVHVAPVEAINQTLPKNNAQQPGAGSQVLDRSAVCYGMGGYPGSPMVAAPSPPPNVRIQQKLWQPPVMGEVPVSYDGMSRPNILGGQLPMSSQMVPCSDMGMNRKRVRMPDGLMDGRPGPIRSPSPHYIPEEVGKQNSKRTKYIQSNDLRYPNVIIGNRHSPYVSAPPTTDDETMTSESILEQMNQTEKRFLPDDDTIARMRSPKKTRPSTSSPKGAGMVQSSPGPFRKRRQVITTVDEDEESEKNRGFCSCSECYEEAAGLNESRAKIAKQSSPLGDSFLASKKKKTVGFSMHSPSTPEKGYISAISVENKSNDVTEKFTPVQMQVITKERHEADKKRRLERLNRMLNESFKRSEYKPEVSPTKPASITEITATPKNLFGSSQVASEDQVEGPGATKSAVSAGNTIATTATTTSAPFSFGAGSAVAVESKETPKPASSESKPVGFSFGMTSTSAPASAVSTGTTKADETTTVSSASSGTTSGFSFGAPPASTSATSVTLGPAPAQITTPSAGFSFGSSLATSQATAISATSSPSLAPTSSVSRGPPPAYGSSPVSAPALVASGVSGPSSTSGGQNTAAAAFSFGSSGARPSAALQDSAKATGLSFGQGAPSFGAVSDASKAPAAATTTSSGFSFGAPKTTQSASSSSSQGMTFLSSATTTTASSIFGQPTASVPSIFGKDSGAGQPPVTSSIFGSNAPATAPATTAATGSAGALAASTAAPASATSSVFSFGAKPAATPAAAPATASGGLFAFGQKADAASPFGQKQEQSTQPNAAGSIFGQPTTQSSGLFGQTASTTASTAPSSSLFSFGAKPSSDAVKSAFGQPSTSAPTFGATATTAGSFGQPTTSTPTFGAATTTAGGFGQSSGFSFGQSTTAAPPAFGQTSTTTAPSFGSAASTAAATTAFGQQSATPTFGQTASTTPSSFGQGSAAPAFGQTGTTPAFGHTVPASTPAFGQGASGSAPSLFGQSSTSSTAPAFGQGTTGGSTFGAASSASPFGQSSAPFGSTGGSGSALGSTPGSTSFGQSSAPPTFGAATTTASFGSGGSTFGGGTTASSFGQSGTATSPFGGAASSPSTFGKPSTQGNTSFGGGSSAFGQASSPNSNGFGFGGASANSNTSFGGQANKSFGQANTTSGGTFSFGSNQQPSAGGFNFGAAAPSANNNASGSSTPFGGGGFGAPQQTANLSFGAAAAAAPSPSQPAAAPGVFQFGQPQQPAQGGFNFSAQAQAGPQFGAAPQQQQQQMFSLGSSSSSSAARRRDPRSRRYRS